MKMKRLKYLQNLLGLAAIILTMFACAPEMEDGIDIGMAPTADQLDFTITKGTSDFKFNLVNTSKITGIPSWDLGNGSKSTDVAPVANYPLPGTYTITMTLVTKGGVASITKTVTQSKTDYSIFNDPMFINLSGGTGATAGKTWVLDSLSRGHLGVGPAGSDGLAWWSANPLAKNQGKIYGDELNFKIVGFAATLTNFGNSYVKDYVKDNAAYSNQVQWDTDYKVNFTPAPGTWFIETKDGKSYLKLSSAKPLFPMFDTGAKNGMYEIIKLEENLLQLAADGGDGNAWAYRLIPKGYVKPQVSYDINVVSTGKVNEYAVNLSNVVVPAGLSISKIKVDFGDGTVKEGTDRNATFTNTFMRKAPYNVVVTVTTSNEVLVKNKTVDVAANHPSYVPFLLDMMVTYADFSEVSMAKVEGENCSVTTVNNPSSIYPNKSSKVARYSKTNDPWANAFMKLAPGYRFDLTKRSTYKILVYGQAGQVILLKLENTDRGGNAWQTGTELTYTIKKSNTWEVAEYNFAGVPGGWDWTGDIFTNDVTKSPQFNNGFYNIVRIMCNPGNDKGTHEFFFDDLSGPHVEGLKSAQIK